MQRRIRVGVIFGGRSGEHEVSLASARSIMENVNREKYDVVAIGISKQGRWLVGGDPLQALTDGQADELAPVSMLPDPQERELMRLGRPGELTPSGPRIEPLDVVFPVLHGTYGEDGTIQGLFELA